MIILNQCIVTVSENDAEGKVNVCITGNVLDAQHALNIVNAQTYNTV